MNKQLNVSAMRFLVGIAFGAAVIPVFAGGGSEAGDHADRPLLSAEGPADATAPIAGADTLRKAVELATRIPSDWEYDPATRVIFNDALGIPFPIQLDEAIWASRLDPFEYYVLREKGTEYAFSNPMHDSKESGTYYSRATGQPLFSSTDKFKSGTGWPSFSRPINPNAIVYILDDRSFGTAIEVVDSLSGSHLGHVFPDGPIPTGQRYCINAASLIFVPSGEEPPPLIQELQALASGQ